MIVKPKVRGFVCITAHPAGCAAHVQQQIDYVKARGPIKDGPKNALILGASTGFGLASRITAAYGSGAKTIGVFFERASEPDRLGTAGWYNTAGFHAAAKRDGLYAKSINGDAFSDEIKKQVIDLIRADLKQVDLVVYSLASPRRTHPRTGVVHKSVLKPIGTKTYTSQSVDTDNNVIIPVAIEPATEQEITDTVAVMGGEDWEMWINALQEAGVLAPGATTVAYDYIGPEVTWDVYHHGTIGRAKIDLRKTAKRLDAQLKAHDYGRALISVNKALVTQASSAIPVVPLYISTLYKIMKEKGTHEGTIEQIQRLFATQLYNGCSVNFDSEGRARIDDLEMRPEVQEEVKKIWPQITTENLRTITDYDSYEKEFLKLFGFGLSGIDYEADVEPHVTLE